MHDRKNPAAPMVYTEIPSIDIIVKAWEVKTSKIKNIKAILTSCVFFIMSAILKQKWGQAKSLESALCEYKVGALSSNQNAGLQCKINIANQGVLEWLLVAVAIGAEQRLLF